jgi:hypothetical protein
MQVHTNRESREENRGWTGPKWARAGQPSPFWRRFGTPFDLATIRTIYSPLAKMPRINSFVIRRRGAEKGGTPFQRGECRDGWLGFP